MGMPIRIDVRDPNITDQALEDAFQWFHHVDRTFSTYIPDSQISRLNAGLIDEASLDQDVRDVLNRCDQLRSETDGYFDIRTAELPLILAKGDGEPVRAGVDPSGYVKGWAVDRAAGILETAGASNYCVDAGGDVRVRGGALPDEHWRVGIQHPTELDKVAAVVETSDAAIATSGEYRRGRHIQDPHTGRPPEGVLSVTIVGPEVGTADAYATAAFAMGDEGPRWTMSLTGYEAMTILSDKLVLSTPGFPKV